MPLTPTSLYPSSISPPPGEPLAKSIASVE
jgi:hypothetical protein